MFASFPGACRSPSPRTRVVWNGRPPSSEPSPGPGRIQSWSDIMVESSLVIKCSPTWWFALCRASNSKQDLRSPGENHSRGFSLHILRHRIIIRALREWTPSPASVLANSALDQRPDNLDGGPCLKSLCPVEVYFNWTESGYIPACPAETYDSSGRYVVQFRRPCYSVRDWYGGLMERAITRNYSRR